MEGEKGGTEAWGIGGLEEAIETHAAWTHRARPGVDGARRRPRPNGRGIWAAELPTHEALCTERLRGDPDLIDAIHAGDRDPYSTARMLLEGQES